MKCVYVSIERNLDVFELYRNLWSKHGIVGIRVDSMTEGIRKAVEIEKSDTDELCFISIVADDIDYIPQLKILSEETSAPILIATSNLSVDDHHTALCNGADFYGLYDDDPKNNIKYVISVMYSIKQRNIKRKVPNKITAHNDILMVDGYSNVYIRDKELNLTRTEMSIFRLLLTNRGNVVLHEQINRHVTKNPDELNMNGIYCTMRRLRDKISKITLYDYIETVRHLGYRLNQAEN